MWRYVDEIPRFDLKLQASAGTKRFLQVDDVLRHARNSNKRARQQLSQLSSTQLELLEKLTQKNEELARDNERILVTGEGGSDLNDCSELLLAKAAPNVLDAAKKISKIDRSILREDMEAKNRAIEELEELHAILKSRNELLRQSEKMALVGESSVVYVPLTSVLTFSEALQGFLNFGAPSCLEFHVAMLDEPSLLLLARVIVEGSNTSNLFPTCAASTLLRFLFACEYLVAEDAFAAAHRELTGAHRNLPADLLTLDDAFTVLLLAQSSAWRHKWRHLEPTALGTLSKHMHSLEPETLQQLSESQMLMLVSLADADGVATATAFNTITLPTDIPSGLRDVSACSLEPDADLVWGDDGSLVVRIITESAGAVALDGTTSASYLELELTCPESPAGPKCQWNRGGYVVWRQLAEGALLCATARVLVEAEEVAAVRAASSVTVKWRLTAGKPEREGRWQRGLHQQCVAALRCLQMPLTDAAALSYAPSAPPPASPALSGDMGGSHSLGLHRSVRNVLLAWTIAHWHDLGLTKFPALLAWSPAEVDCFVRGLAEDGASAAGCNANARLLAFLTSWAAVDDVDIQARISSRPGEGVQARTLVLDQVLESVDVGQGTALGHPELTAQQQGRVMASAGFRRMIDKATQQHFRAAAPSPPKVATWHGVESDVAEPWGRWGPAAMDDFVVWNDGSTFLDEFEPDDLDMSAMLWE